MKREPAAALTTALRWRWLLALEVALALGLGAALYAESLPARFQATSVVAFTPSASVGADELRVLLPRYPVLLSSASSYRQVSSQTGVSVDELRSGVRIATPADTANVQISVTSTGPRIAADVANVLASIAVAASAEDPLLTGDVVAPAIADPRAAGPPRRLIEAAGAVVALLAGLVAAVLAEQARPRLWRLEDIRRLHTAAVIGRLPSHAAARPPHSSALRDPVIGARIRSVRSQLLGRDPSEGGAGVLLVTAASRGQGATTVANLLALSFGNLAQPTLLIDGDMHAPAVARRMGLDDGPHLSKVLRDGTSLRRASVPVSSTLCVLSAEQDDEGGDLLATRMPDLLEEARASFATVLIDGPPMLEGDVGTTLATLADRVLLVVQHGSLASDTVDALDLFDRLKIPVVGLLLNGFPDRRGGAARRSRRPAPAVVQMRSRAARARTA